MNAGARGLTGIILAGGRSKRYTDAGRQPKALAPINDVALILHVAAGLVEGGATRQPAGKTRIAIPWVRSVCSARPRIYPEFGGTRSSLKRLSKQHNLLNPWCLSRPF
jgi:hypothetical protein